MQEQTGVYVITDKEEISNHHMLYVSRCNKQEYKELLNNIDEGKFELTVNDKQGFVDKVDVVEFINMKGETKSNINVDEAKQVRH